MVPEKNRKYRVKSNTTPYLNGIEGQILTMRNWKESVKYSCWFKEGKCPSVLIGEVPASSDMVLIVVAPTGNYIITFSYVEPVDPAELAYLKKEQSIETGTYDPYKDTSSGTLREKTLLNTVFGRTTSVD